MTGLGGRWWGGETEPVADDCGGAPVEVNWGGVGLESAGVVWGGRGSEPTEGMWECRVSEPVEGSEVG